MATKDESRRPRWGLGSRREAPAPGPAEDGPVRLGAPVTGAAVPLADVEDPAFSAGLLGPGMAVRPTSGTVVAPLAGTVVTAMPHAYGLRSDTGVEVLVHIGIDTVSLNGQHFAPAVEAGARVAAGDVLARVDLAGVEAAGCPTTVVLVVTNAPALGGVETGPPGPVDAGRTLLTVTPAA